MEVSQWALMGRAKKGFTTVYDIDLLQVGQAADHGDGDSAKPALLDATCLLGEGVKGAFVHKLHADRQVPLVDKRTIKA